LDTKDLVSILFGLTALIAVSGGILNRFQLQKGIGAQFIRFNTVVIALPVSAVLALNGMLTEAAVSIISGALGYAFAGIAKDE